MRDLLDRSGLHSPAREQAMASALARMEQPGLEMVRIAWCDLHGAARGKALTVQAAAKAAIDRHGVSASASRMVSGERPLHGALEAALAAHYRAEAALAFVSGHATNVTVIGHLLGPRDLIVHDAAIHNSCTEGVRLSGAKRLSFAHNDWRAAEAALAEARRGARRALLVVEGHYSMN